MMIGRVNCGCRVAWSAVVEACGLPTGTQAPDSGFDVQPDWAGRESLSTSDAGRFVAEYRLSQAEAQRRQDELNASRRDAEAARQAAERAIWDSRRREEERARAIQKGGAAAVDSLTGLVSARRQQEAFLDGAALARELFDKQHSA